jgi:hypothetical protein
LSQQAVSAGIIPNSAVEIFTSKTEETNTKAGMVPTDKVVTTHI